VDVGFWGLRVLVFGTAAASVGCSSPPPAAPPQVLPIGVEYGGPSSSLFGASAAPGSEFGKGLRVPDRAQVDDSAHVTVRPDALRMGFAVRELGATPEAALEAARTKVQSVAAELIKAMRPTAQSKILGFRLARNLRGGQPVDVSASVDGALEVPLAEGEDLWARARLLATLIAAAERLAQPASDDDLRAVSFATPELVLLDPEPYRAELVKRWVERARGFAAAAQVDSAPLVIRECAPPGPIVQSSPAFDEVSLELTFTCRIDTVSGGVGGIR